MAYLCILLYSTYAVLQARWVANTCLKVGQIERDEYQKAFWVNVALAPVFSAWMLWCLFLNWRDSWK